MKLTFHVWSWRKSTQDTVMCKREEGKRCSPYGREGNQGCQMCYEEEMAAANGK